MKVVYWPMDRKKIILVSAFYNEKSDNARISTVYNLLKEKGAEIELITADYNHRTKEKHNQKKKYSDITFLLVPEYKLNISFQRLYSHFIFAIRLYIYLKKLTYLPCKIYCHVPTVSSGVVCNLYCRKKKLPFVVDVIDLWPESFLVLSRHKKLFQWLTYPWKKLAEKVYS